MTDHFIAPSYVPANLIWRCQECQAAGKAHVVTPPIKAILSGKGEESLEAWVEMHELFSHGIPRIRAVKEVTT